MSSVDYANYLQLDALLDLQRPLAAPEVHDETLFIVVHQVHELWFKQILHECRRLPRAFAAASLHDIMNTLRRICTILKTLVTQVDILETMTPQSFSKFRANLQTASGFQSEQFRLLEVFLGKRPRRLRDAAAKGGPMARAFEAPSLYDLFAAYLVDRGVAVPDQVLHRRRGEPTEACEAMQQVLVQVYRQSPELAALCERLVDLDEGFQEWRYRHVQMVQRTIGVKMGTGGSRGAAYLKDTLFRPFFPDLWEIRRAL